MRETNKNRQAGIAMILEVVLAAIIIFAIGVVIYQVRHKTPTATTTNQKTAIKANVSKTTPLNSGDATLDSLSSEADKSVNQLDSETKSVDTGLNDKQGDLSE